MKQERFLCELCQESFVIEVLEPGEAEYKKIRPPAIGGAQLTWVAAVLSNRYPPITGPR